MLHIEDIIAVTSSTSAHSFIIMQTIVIIVCVIRKKCLVFLPMCNTVTDYNHVIIIITCNTMYR